MTVWWAGKPVAESLLEDVRRQASCYHAEGVIPTLAVVLAEGRGAARTYAKAKQKRGIELGIRVEVHTLPETAGTETWLRRVRALGEDPRVHGILVELPLPPSVDVAAVIQAIPPVKDVDGLRRTVVPWAETGPHIPATPLAVMRLLEYYGELLRGREVVLVGCGRTVGRPLLDLLLQAEATVHVCHAATRDVGQHLRRGEIGIIAAGCRGLITPDMVHRHLALVDVGIHPLPGGGIAGDVTPEAAQRVRAATPVPGGVGVVTTAQLFANLMDAVQAQRFAGSKDREASATDGRRSVVRMGTGT